MWNYIQISLNGLGAGSNQLYVDKTRVFMKFAVPAQPGIISGGTDIVITEIAGIGNTPLGTLLTITNITTPYSKIPKDVGVTPANVADTQYNYYGIGSLDIAVTQGTPNTSVGVWVLTDDD